jgi:hypothetical protein
VESLDKIAQLKVALGDDANQVMFADMAGVGANPARIIPAWQDSSVGMALPASACAGSGSRSGRSGRTTS